MPLRARIRTGEFSQLPAHRLTLLVELSQRALSQQDDLESLSLRGLHLVAAELRAQRGELLRLVDGRLAVAHAVGWPPDELAGINASEDPLATLVVDRGEAVLVDRRNRGAFPGAYATRLRKRCALFVPLKARGAALGVLALHSRSWEPWGAPEIQFAGSVALVLAAALDQQRTHHALLTSERRLSVLLDAIIAGVITADVHGRISSANRAARQIFGYAEEELIGANVSVLVAPEHRARHAQGLARFSETERPQRKNSTWEGLGRRKDGSTFPVELDIAAIEIGGERMLSGIVRDISERKTVERALRESDERCHALQLQHTELERVAVAGELAGIVSHEIRMPLNAISINAQMIERLLRGPAEQRPRAVELVAKVRAEIERIHALLEDYLKLLRRPRPPRLAPVALDVVAHEAIGFVRPTAARAGVELRWQGGARSLFALADGDRLRQVLLNLLLNAIEAMPSGGCATARGTSEADRVVLSVTDNGPGIPPADLERIFNPFVTTKAKGTGLGLAICRRLVEEMGGSLSATSPPGEGATFAVSLAAVSDAAGSARSPSPGL